MEFMVHKLSFLGLATSIRMIVYSRIPEAQGLVPVRDMMSQREMQKVQDLEITITLIEACFNQLLLTQW
jgi:hypothetical protein